MIANHSPQRDQRGLTLLEVLAATLIFAMVMTVLIGTSTTAVYHIGVSARRLEANEIADRILSDLEIQFKQRLAPSFELEESEQDPFLIRVESKPVLNESAGGQGQGLGAGSPSGGGISSILGAKLPVVAKHLRQYEIEVSWLEKDGLQAVNRTTFAFDWQAAAAEFANLFQSGDGESSSDGIDIPEIPVRGRI